MPSMQNLNFSETIEYWGDRLGKLPKDHIDHLGLDKDTSYFLTAVGLPNTLDEIGKAIEINFYFDRERIVRKEFKGVSYVVIGDDVGTKFGISLNDRGVYTLDFSDSMGIDPICFVNSNINRFVDSIQLFIDIKKMSEHNAATDNELTELLKAKIVSIDKEALADERTWWGQIINDLISG